MKLAPSSSFSSRRLTALIAALLPLVSTHLMGEEALKQLATNHETERLHVGEPKLEYVSDGVTFSFSEYMFDIEIEMDTELSLLIEPISIALLDDETLSHKISPFQVKKNINFNREIAKCEQEKFSQTFRKKQEDPLLAQPNLEKKSSKKHDFLSERLAFDVEKRKLQETAPFAFDSPEDKSSLINRSYSHKKVEPAQSHAFDEIESASPSPSPFTQVKSSDQTYFPQKEGYKKERFSEDELFICFEEPELKEVGFSFKTSSSFDENLSHSSLTPSKGEFSKNVLFTDRCFSEIKGGDFSRMTKECVEIDYYPVRENCEGRFRVEGKEIALELPSQTSEKISFKDMYVSLSFSSSSFQSEKIGKREFSIDHSFSVALPYIYTGSYTEEKSCESYQPTEERATPLPKKYAIGKGPTLAFELSDKVIAFALTPEFDLYAGEDRIELPKKVQEFQTSSIAVLEPYLDSKNQKITKGEEPNPLLEKHEALALQEGTQALDLGDSFSKKQSFELKSEDESVSILSRSMEFSHYQSEKRASEFPIDRRVSLGTLLNEGDHEVLMTPRAEEIPGLELSKNFEFDFTGQLGGVPLSFSQTAGADISDRTHLRVPKLVFPQSLSGIAIPEKNHLKNGEMILQSEEKSFYAPSFQQSKVPFSESTVVLSIPLDRGELLAFQQPIGKEEIVLLKNKRENSKLLGATPFSSIALDIILPNVKLKDIAPRGGPEKLDKVLKDVPEIERMKELVARGGKKLNLEEAPYSVRPFEEREEEFVLKHSHRRPFLPAYFPPEGTDSFHLETSYSAIKEEQLDYVKNRMTPTESSVFEFELPFFEGRKVISRKAPLTPRTALEDLPEVEKMVELAMRDESFPNTRKLLEKNPFPSPIKNEVELTASEIESVDTAMIRSKGKEMVEDYDQENRYSSGLIVLEAPSLEVSPKGPEAKILNQTSRFTNAFLTEIPPPSHLETVSYANEFETEVHYTRREDGKGYYFALKLKPGEKLNFASPSQNYIFVLDGSSSIKKHRFGVFKEGVARALSYLDKGDSFNIVIADAKMRSLSESAVSWNKGSTAKAKNFLMDQAYRGFFVNYDAFDLISKVTRYFVQDKENIVVLLTDGHSFSTLRDHKDDFKELSKANGGKFSVFTATASQGNNLTMLDLLSTFNNGELMYSKTNASFSRQLSVLVKHIESFVAKNIHINVTGASLNTGIEFYPNEQTLPSLYGDRPYVIYGSIDKLKDFDIILQGRAGDQWINVKQSISFKHAIAATHAIKKGMALQKAYVCYDYFMKNEDSFFLSEAQKILEPLNIPTAMR